MTSGSKGPDERILAFFGSDLAVGKAKSFLKKMVGKGYTLMALDSAAMAAAREADAPYRLIEDYLEPAGLYQALVQANECRVSWFEPAREDFTVDGVCWPEMDTGSSRHFWSNAALAMTLARRFKSASVAELRFFRHFSPRPQVASAKSDTVGLLWERGLPGIAKPFITFEQLHGSRLLHALGRALTRLSRGRQPVSEKSPDTAALPQDGICLVIGPSEAFRFSNIIDTIRQRFPGKVGVVIAEPSQQVYESLAWTETVPIRLGPVFPVESWIPPTLLRLLYAGRSELGQRFLRGYFKARDHAAGRPWQRPLEVLRDHFEYYCLYRWPRLHQNNLRFWADFWASNPSALVIASSVEDTRFRMAVAMANQHGIPTAAIPHAATVGNPGHSIISNADYILYGNGFQKIAFERTGFPKSRMFACTGLTSANEYPVAKVQAFAPSGKLRVLAVTDSTDEGVNIAKMVGLGYQYVALQSLVEPPVDLKDKVDIRVKVHPRFQDLDMIASVGPNLMAKVMPAGSDLQTALEQTDLVVAVNYCGSALIHAYGAGKPVICFLTIPRQLTESDLNYFEIFTEGAEVARTPGDLWEVIRCFVNDPQYAHCLQQKAVAFARDFLDDSGHLDIADILKEFFHLRSI